MTPELGVDAIPRSAQGRADGMRDVPDPGPRTGSGDPRGQRAFGRLDKRDALQRPRVAHEEADGRVRGDTARGDGDVERQQVAVAEPVPMRPPVQHGVVDGGADVVAEGPPSEGRRVVHVTGLRSRLLDHGPGPSVDVEEVRAHGAASLECVQDVADQGTRLPGLGQLAGAQDLDQRTGTSSRCVAVVVVRRVRTIASDATTGLRPTGTPASSSPAAPAPTRPRR